MPDGPAMQALGARLATMLRAGDLVVLDGALGAGKTTFAQGVGAGLGVTEPVRSPTFVLAREHDGGRLPLVHVDAYRLGSLAELDQLDLDTALPEAVMLVEWGGGLAESLADGHLLVQIRRSEGGPGTPADEGVDETRTVRLQAYGRCWHGRQHDLDTLA